jgi:acyl-coenzyme A synthetase/AMP-(fatty) acid ligase
LSRHKPAGLCCCDNSRSGEHSKKHASARHSDTGSARAERDSITVDKIVLHCRHVAFSHPAHGDVGYGDADVAEALLAFCRRHLSAIKCPRSIDFEAELSRHPTGKLYKRLLRDRHWQGRESKIV